MEINVIMLINLLAYSIVVSQSFTYIIALRNVQQRLQPAAYIELRKLLDKNYQSKHRLVIYISLLSCTTLTILCSMNPSGLLFLTTATALVALISDVILAVTGNLPINKIINSWSAETYPENWQFYRTQWLSVFARRQVLTIAGFTSLLIGAIFS